MRQFFLLAVFALALFSCSGGKNQGDTSVPAFELDNLLAVAEQAVNDTLTVVGYVTHTCMHSGKRCIIVGESQKTSLRVEAEGEIESFSSELIGSKLSITGILKEQRLNQDFIDEMENDVKQLQQEGAEPEACAAELSNIGEWRQWMADNNKDYYVIYYMDGLKYEILD